MGQGRSERAKLGLDIDKVFEVITAWAGNSWMFENRIVLAGDHPPPAWGAMTTRPLPA